MNIEKENNSTFEKLEKICNNYILEDGEDQVNLPHYLTEKIKLDLKIKNAYDLFITMQTIKVQCKKDLLCDSVKLINNNKVSKI
jgi:hypothetical protein